MRRKTTTGRLRIARETLRVLTPARLRAVAGAGRKVDDSGGCLFTTDEKDLAGSAIDTHPRSNAWTSDIDATC